MYSSQIPTQRIQKSQINSAVGKRILIVDDQEAVLFFLQDRLKQLGFEVFPASNGKEGIHLFQETSFQGVLLDLEMSVVKGFTILSQLRKLNSAIPIIVMSADPTRTAMIKAIEAGARDYLTKPISYVILKYKCLRLFS